ncbi:MAG: glycosyltransferase [Phycisphaerales bacterium]|nr:glycosyltransferase [Phycisphaerales bacterium]
MASLPTFKHCKLAVISSYVPRRCGIATFCSDLTRAMTEELGNHGELYVLAIDDIPEGYRYPDEVRFQIRSNVQADYRLAADFILSNQANALIVQHEYGIFGGPAGAHILRLLREVPVPVITTLHTVLAAPTPEQRKVMDELWRLSDRLVVMSQRAIDMLREIYGVPAERIAYIPHGIPDVPFVDPNYHKAQFKAEGRRVILSFGLLSPNKGIEVMIEAMPEIIRRFPDVIYFILGATHPHLKKVHGEAYRTSLQRRVVDLGLVENVRFRNQFVDLEELLEYIGAADLYVTPYLNEAQITSGTLAYAVGSGKPVVSTPYWHAQELLADGRGILVPFRDPAAMAEATNYLFENDIERNQMRIKAYHHCRNMVWKQVAREYLLLVQAAQEERMERPRPLPRHRKRVGRIEELPELDLSHLRALTDDTGILQHAMHTTPDRQHGYCLDDCGRALVVCALHDQLFQSNDLDALANVYLAYLNHAFIQRSRRFHNFMSYSRQWLDNEGSEDSHGRALWGLGMMAAHATNENLRSVSVSLFQPAVGVVEGFSSPRSWAYALLGIHAYLEHYGGDAGVRRLRLLLAEKLFALFREHADQEWPWFETTATYSNATIPHALILAGTWIPDGPMREQGLRTLRWLCDVQRSDQGYFSFIGNSGWYPRGGEKARFDQQPIEAAQLCYACAEAYRATVDEQWLAESRLAVEWFLGRNDLDVPIYDFASGGCRDGLSPGGPNFNQGAESTLAWLISLLTFLNQVSRQTLHVKPGGALEQADSTRADTVVAQADMSH